MATIIRLSRVGSTKEARYRIVVAPKRSKRDGKALDVLGWYAPLYQESKQVELDTKKYAEWMTKGALPSRTVASLHKRVTHTS
jgi:small subunit ribosomal protein S16